MSKNAFLGMAAACLVVAILAAVAAALGVFARGDGTFVTVVSPRGVTYEMATTGIYANNAQRLVSEGVGWDLFTLGVAVPAMVGAAALVARGSFRGRLFALGLLGYFLYQYLEYSVTWAFGPLFLVYIVAYAASLGGIVWIGASIAREGVQHRFDRRFPARRWAALAVGLGVILTMLWLQRIGAGLSGDLESAGLYGETTMVVQALDLGLVVPAMVFVGVLAWRRTPVGHALSAILVVAFAAMALAITSMVISAGIVDGAFEAPPIVMFAGAALAAILLGVRMYRAGGGRPTQETPAARVEAAGVRG